MKDTIIIYGSTTGNTETVANWIKDALSSSGTESDIFDVAGIAPDEAADYNTIILGSSTWGSGDIQDDFYTFYEAMSAEYFTGKKVAVFGCGDSDMFPDCFCEAVDKIAEKAKECGAEIIADLLKIDGDIDSFQQETEHWAKGLV